MLNSDFSVENKGKKRAVIKLWIMHKVENNSLKPKNKSCFDICQFNHSLTYLYIIYEFATGRETKA